MRGKDPGEGVSHPSENREPERGKASLGIARLGEKGSSGEGKGTSLMPEHNRAELQTDHRREGREEVRRTGTVD